MIVDHDQPPVPPTTVASAEQAASDSAATPQLNAEKIKTSGEGVDLIGDTTSWPSLSESTRPSLRSSPAPPSDPPVSAAQAPAVSHSAQRHGRPNNNTTPNSNPNRQRLLGRGGTGRGGASRGGYIRHPPPPQQFPSPPHLPPAFYGGFEGSMRGPFFYGNGFGSHPRPIDNHFSNLSSSHGAHPRGDGGHHHKQANYQGPDWSVDPQGYHAVDVRFPRPGATMGFTMPQQSVIPFTYIRAPIYPPEPFMGMLQYTRGHAPVPPSSLSPPPFVDLKIKLLNQINYYFSDENLIKDMYLRTKMDDGGWVPVTLIAGFKKVRDLTQDIQLILGALGASSMVEVQGDKIRRRNDWRRWIPTSSVSKEPTTELNSMIRYLQNATLEEAHAADRSTSGAATASSSRREVLT